MKVEALSRRIEQELNQIREAVAQTHRLIEKMQQTDDEDILRALVSASALNLHSFYTGAERIFSEIAKEIDGYVPTGSAWDRQLLEQISAEIPHVRRPVISNQTLVELEQFRRFRQFVLSNYAYNLKPELVVKLAKILPSCSISLIQESQRFCDQLK